MAQLLAGFDWDRSAAERAFKRAIVLDPGFEEARHLYGIFLFHWSRIDEAEAELTRTLEIDPLLAAAHHTFGRLHLSMRRPDQAITHLREALTLEPMFSLAHSQLGHAYLQKGMSAEAITEFEAGARIGSASDKAHLAYGYARVGRHEDAKAILANLVSPGNYPPPFHMGRHVLWKASQWLSRTSTGLLATAPPWGQPCYEEPSIRGMRRLRNDCWMLVRRFMVHGKIGFRVRTDVPRASAELVDRFREHATSNIADVMVDSRSP